MCIYSSLSEEVVEGLALTAVRANRSSSDAFSILFGSIIGLSPVNNFTVVPSTSKLPEESHVA
jgi:hypothetical protein